MGLRPRAQGKRLNGKLRWTPQLRRPMRGGQRPPGKGDPGKILPDPVARDRTGGPEPQARGMPREVRGAGSNGGTPDPPAGPAGTAGPGITGTGTVPGPEIKGGAKVMSGNGEITGVRTVAREKAKAERRGVAKALGGGRETPTQKS